MHFKRRRRDDGKNVYLFVVKEAKYIYFCRNSKKILENIASEGVKCYNENIKQKIRIFLHIYVRKSAAFEL